MAHPAGSRTGVSPWIFRIAMTIGFVAVAIFGPLVFLALKGNRSGWSIPEILSVVWAVAFLPQIVSMVAASLFIPRTSAVAPAITFLSAVPASWIYALIVERILVRRAAK